MTTAAEFLLHIRRVIRLYESLNRQVCDTWHITQIETDIIAFLKNNPEKDTARDIVEFRMLQKGNVSQAVEDLIQKGFLARRPDGGTGAASICPSRSARSPSPRTSSASAGNFSTACLPASPPASAACTRN